MTFEELESKVLDWADSHDLLHEENADKQFMKFIEEVFEFKTEMDIWHLYKKFKHNEKIRQDFSIEEFERWKNLKLEMGDIIVTLIILCKNLGIDPMECLEIAYNKIKDRKGKIVVGKFMKAEDLESGSMKLTKKEKQKNLFNNICLLADNKKIVKALSGIVYKTITLHLPIESIEEIREWSKEE